MASTISGVFVDDSGQTRFRGSLQTTGTATSTFAATTVSASTSVITPLVTAVVAASGVKVGATGDFLGFYGTAPIAQQTGVAVSAGGIHAALVALGLFTA